MTSFFHITEEDVFNTVSMVKAIDVVEEAFIALGQGKSIMPSKIYLDLPDFNGDFRAMPTYEASQGFAGMKWVNVHLNNSKKKLPTVMGVVLLNDPSTGTLLATVESTLLTSIRTGAAGGIAVKYLAKKEASSVAFVGLGVQAYYQLEAILLVRSIKVIQLYDLKQQSIDKFLKRIQPLFSGEIIICESIESCVGDVDIVVTTTPSCQPIIFNDWLKKDVHINAIGADAQGKCECDYSILKSAQLIVDDYEQSIHSGEINVAYRNNIISRRDIFSTLASVICGEVTVDSNQCSLFDSTGLAIQDIALSGYIYSKLVHL